MQFFAGSTFDFLSAFSSILIVAVSFYIVFGVMRVYNMAHGEFVMIGAYCASLAQANGMGLWAPPLLTIVACSTLGVTLEALVVRRLYHRRDLSTLLATWGVSIVMSEACKMIFGPAGRFVDAPVTGVINFGGAAMPLYNFIVIGVGALMMAALYAMLRWTNLGLVVRATMEDPQAAAALGIAPSDVYRGCFVTSCVLAGLSGMLLAPTTAVTPSMGLGFTLRSVLVVLVAGPGMIAAPLVGSGIIGGTRSVLGSAFDVTTATMGMLIVVVLLLLFRPSGLIKEA